MVNSVNDIKDGLQGVEIFLQGNINACPSGMNTFDDKFASASENPIPKSVRDGMTTKDTLCYINTSGTTGRQKTQQITDEFCLASKCITLC